MWTTLEFVNQGEKFLAGRDGQTLRPYTVTKEANDCGVVECLNIAGNTVKKFSSSRVWLQNQKER